MIKINILIDIGNTNTKYCYIATDVEWHKIDNCAVLIFSNSRYSSFEYRKDNLLEFPIIFNLPKNSIIHKVYISNVSKSNYSYIIKYFMSNLLDSNHIVEYKSEKEYKNLINGYIDYNKLGADRWLSLIAADGLYSNETNIIISLGTATTLDIIYNNKFIGGYIIPGVLNMQTSLLLNTENIKFNYNKNENENELTKFNELNLFPSTNTKDCIDNGIILSHISFIEKCIFSFIKNKDVVKYNCLIYGGNAKYIYPFLNIPHVSFNNMVMLGLARVLND